MPTVIVGKSQKVIQGPIISLCFLLDRPLRRTPWDRRFLRTSGFSEKTLMLEANGWYVPLLVYLVIKAKGEMASVVAWSSWARPKVCVFFISFLDSPGSLERTSTGVTVTFSMERLYLMKWSYKKFLYLRLDLFLILNEWLRKRSLRVWDAK